MISINQLAGYAMVFVMAGIVLGMGALILDETQDQTVTITGCNESAICAVEPCCLNLSSYTTQTGALQGLDTFGNWQPILAIVIVAGIVIALLLGSFMMRGRA